MKKFAKILMCAICTFCLGFLFTACGEEETPPEPPAPPAAPAAQEVSVTPEVGIVNSLTAYGVLPGITATATCNGQTVEGSIAWVENQEIVLEKLSYNWTFTPSDTSKYLVKNGTYTFEGIEIQKATPIPEQTSITLDVDNPSATKVKMFVGSREIDGTFAWTTTSNLIAGNRVDLDYTFTSNDINCENVEGTISVMPLGSPKMTGFKTNQFFSTGAGGLNVIQLSFEYGNVKDIPGTLTFEESELVPGKNTLHYIFTPTDADRYLPVSGTIEVVAFDGTGTTVDPYMISDADQLMLIASDAVRGNFKLNDNIDLSGINLSEIDAENVNSIKSIISGAFTGTFDGGGYTLFGLDASNTDFTITIFERLEGGATIKNLTVSGLGQISLVAELNGSGMVQIDGVTMSGSAKNASNNYAPFAIYVSGEVQSEFEQNELKVLFNNCTNAYEVVGTGKVSAFVAYVIDGRLSKLSFEGCKNEANVFGDYAGLFVGYASSEYISKNISSVNDCENIGSIKGAQNASLFGYHDTQTTHDGFTNSGTIAKVETISDGISLTESGLSITTFKEGVYRVEVVMTIVLKKDDSTTRLTQLLATAEDVRNLPNEKVQLADIVLMNDMSGFTYGNNEDGSLVRLVTDPETNEKSYVICQRNADGYDANWTLDGAPYITIYYYDANGEIMGASAPISLVNA